MRDLFEDVAMEDDQEFEHMMTRALREPEAAVPAGLEARMQAWTAQAMEAKQLARQAPVSSRFSDFGVLNAGRNSRGAFFASAAMNVAVAFVIIIIAGVARHTYTLPERNVVYINPSTTPVKVTTPPPVREVVAPKPIEQPPVEHAKVELPPDVTPMMSSTPKLNLTTPASAKVTPAPAAKAVNLSAAPAAIPNNSPRPSAVALGRPDSPLKSALSGPPVSRVNLGAGVNGASAGNTGTGAPSKIVGLGSGPATSNSLAGHGNGPVAIKGLAGGKPDGNGTGLHGPVVVEIAPAERHFEPTAHPAVLPHAGKPPVVTFVPTPAYSEEARALHLEGDVKIKVRLLANGKVEVLGIARGLGHGLDESAMAAATNIRFKPAIDGNGNAVDFATEVTVHFLHD